MVPPVPRVLLGKLLVRRLRCAHQPFVAPHSREEGGREMFDDDHDDAHLAKALEEKGHAGLGVVEVVDHVLQKQRHTGHARGTHAHEHDVLWGSIAPGQGVAAAANGRRLRGGDGPGGKDLA